MRVTVLVFVAELQKVRTTCIFSVIERWLGRVQNGMYVEEGKRHYIIRFFRIYVEISQLGRNVIKMALKWKSKRDSIRLTSTHKTTPKSAALWLAKKHKLKFSGFDQKPDRPRPFGTVPAKHCSQGLFSPFFTFLRVIFFPALLDFPLLPLSSSRSPRMDIIEIINIKP